MGLSLLALLSALTTAAAATRLRVEGNQLIDPAGSPVRLTGFNWQLGRTGPDPGGTQRRLAPNATAARLVGVLWGNTQPLASTPDKECMTLQPPHYFDDRCFDLLDPWVRSASAAGLWVVLAVRGEYIAGQNFASRPGESVFRNATLRQMMQGMWRHVAAHYAQFENIGAYEILSEPRDKTAPQTSVRELYEAGCGAVRAGDPSGICLVGSAPYYQLWTLSELILLRGFSQVIYTFDYFNPSPFVFGRSGVPQYGRNYSCKELYPGWASVACKSWNSTNLQFGREWHAHNLELFTRPVRGWPVLMNQFEVAHGVSAAAGRYDYIRDLLSVAKGMGFGWAWWTWAGGNEDGWAHGSSEVVFRFPNGTTMVDNALLEAMSPYF